MSLDIRISDDDLPTLSVIAAEALKLINNENVTNSKIEALIKQDVALSQRILTVANSAFYCGRQQAQTIATAITRLGLRQLRSVIIMAATGELFNAEDVHVQQIWGHSVATALASQLLAKELGGVDTEEAFLGGMLHDVGKLVIYHQHPGHYGRTLDRARLEERRLIQVEKEDFELFTHETVGGLVVKRWRLSEHLADCARFHHIVEQITPPLLSNPKLVCTVSMASIIVNLLGYGAKAYNWESIPTLNCAEVIKFPAERIEVLAEKISAVCESHRALVA